MGDCDHRHPHNRQKLVLHQRKDMPPQSSVHLMSSNKTASQGPSSCKIPCDG